MRARCWLLAAVATTGAASSMAQPELEAEARAVANRFAQTLKPTLMAALEKGGPVGAVEVCAEQAPAIAQRLSEESGWEVRRVSLKPRNPSAGPDAWATTVLEDFDRRVADGKTPNAVFVLTDGEARLLVPQLTGPLCLTCHGLPTGDLAQALGHLYPDDMATGYEAGEVRGAISVRRKLP